MRQGAKRDLARRLRQAMTDAERALWRHLRMRQIAGARFRRQHPIGPYVVDFVCLDPRVVIEVDGGQHAESRSDAARDAFLRTHGYRVLRFWNHEVLGNPEGVWLRIAQALREG